MKDAKIIDGGQLVCMLALSRIFSIMVYMPKNKTDLFSPEALAGNIISFALEIFIILLCQRLYDKAGKNVLNFALSDRKIKGFATAIIFFAFLSFYSIKSIINFEFFLTSVVYPNQSSFLIILLFSVCAGYSAAMGPEAFGRMSVIIFVAFVLTVGIIAVMLLPDFRMLNIYASAENGFAGIGKSAWISFTFGSELIVFYLFSPLTGKKFKRTGLWFLALTALMIELLTLLTIGVLGYYSSSQLFPIYTLFTTAQFSIFDRMDALYMSVWVFVALIKSSVYIYASSQCLSVFVPRLKSRTAAILCSVAFAACATLVSSSVWLVDIIAFIGNSGMPIIVCAVLIPLWLLLKSYRKEKVR